MAVDTFLMYLANELRCTNLTFPGVEVKGPLALKIFSFRKKTDIENNRLSFLIILKAISLQWIKFWSSTRNSYTLKYTSHIQINFSELSSPLHGIRNPKSILLECLKFITYMYQTLRMKPKKTGRQEALSWVMYWL